MKCFDRLFQKDVHSSRFFSAKEVSERSNISAYLTCYTTCIAKHQTFAHTVCMELDLDGFTSVQLSYVCKVQSLQMITWQLFLEAHTHPFSCPELSPRYLTAHKCHPKISLYPLHRYTYQRCAETQKFSCLVSITMYLPC